MTKNYSNFFSSVEQFNKFTVTGPISKQIGLLNKGIIGNITFETSGQLI